MSRRLVGSVDDREARAPLALTIRIRRPELPDTEQRRGGDRHDERDAERVREP
jgi:hypothetical protein